MFSMKQAQNEYLSKSLTDNDVTILYLCEETIMVCFFSFLHVIIVSFSLFFTFSSLQYYVYLRPAHTNKALLLLILVLAPFLRNLHILLILQTAEYNVTIVLNCCRVACVTWRFVTRDYIVT